MLPFSMLYGLVNIQENILFYISWNYDIMSIATAVLAQAGIMRKQTSSRRRDDIMRKI